MPNHMMLNELQHREVRVHTGHGAAYGDNVMCVLAIPSEFRSLVADYPIFLHKDPDSDKFLPMAMFGFEAEENLFLEGDQWRANYLPLMVQRGPFLIGFQDGEPGLSTERNMVVTLDMDNPRLGTEGEALFQPFGGNSEYTDKVVGILQDIDQGQAAIDELNQALVTHDLVEPFSLDVRLNNGESHRLEGFYTVHEERLSELDADVLADFSRRGILHAAYMQLASMSNIPRLIQLRNQRG